MASTPMKHLLTLGKYKFYWAGKAHMYKGLWVWSGVKNLRIVPVNRFKNWSGRED